MKSAKQLGTKPTKSLSSRSFLKSARTVDQPTPTSRRLKTATSEREARPSPRNIDQNHFHTIQGLQVQNHTLKVKINSLKETINKQNSKYVHDNQTLMRIKKQFENYDQEKYFVRGGNLVEGVKHQYRLIKNKYELKCKQFENLIGKVEVSQREEASIYCQAIEEENRQLRRQLETILKLENMLQRDNPKSNIVVQELLGVSSRIVNLEQQLQVSNNRNLSLLGKIQKLNKKINDKQRKIQFLDKLLTEKTNQLHSLSKINHRLNKQSKIVEQTIKRLKQKLAEKDKQTQNQIQKLRQRQQIKFQTQKKIFNECLMLKQQEIEILKRKLEYLSTVISYIQSGDRIQPQMQQELQLVRKQSKGLPQLQKALMSLQQNIRKRVQTQYQSPKIQPNSFANQTQQIRFTRKLSSQLDQSSQQQFSLRQTSNQMVRLSSIKHSPGCKRVRLVRLQQIQHMRDELVYRLIHYRWEFSRIDSAFQGQNTYVTMGQICTMLKKYPFDLSQTSAEMLGRYIVQDNTSTEVFYHKDNQIQRNIAVSILKAFVRQYTLPDIQQAKLQIIPILQKYGRNLNSALSSLVPSGFITSAKLIQISAAIQVTFTVNARDFILAQLLAKSSAWDKLEYSHLFKDWSKGSAGIF